ncbi:hypothetical protein K438DRAFT_1747440 [Mycena galopus ATCC 62051]|nr:hypothetical protein K438DRAFT_1747440 [Mycena galopus ATCC 62051]
MNDKPLCQRSRDKTTHFGPPPQTKPGTLLLAPVEFGLADGKLRCHLRPWQRMDVKSRPSRVLALVLHTLLTPVVQRKLHLPRRQLVARRWELLIANCVTVDIGSYQLERLWRIALRDPVLPDNWRSMSRTRLARFLPSPDLPLALLYLVAAAMSSDPVGPPANWEWTQDFLWAIVLLASPAVVGFRYDTVEEQFAVPAGLSNVKLLLDTTGYISTSILRRDASDVEFSPPGFSFSTKPPTST